MTKVLKRLGVAALAVCVTASAVLPANAAVSFQYPTSVTGVTVSGHPLTDSELSKGSYLINLVKGHSIFFDVHSTQPVNFVSGNGKCAQTGVIQSYNRSADITRYEITGTGSTGQTCGLYLDNNRIFQAQIKDMPASQPFISDTTEPLTKKVGQTYTFKITLKDPHSNATFVAGNGSVLSTYAPPGITGPNGSKIYYYSVTALKTGGSGIYVSVDGVTYHVFSETVVTNTNTQPSAPSEPSKPSQPSKPVPTTHYTFTPTVTSSCKTYKKGIDVSEWQGTIDWDTAKKAGVEFAMIRAGYGNNNIDACFKRNISECNRLGIPVGVYWYSYALSASGAAREAQDCLNAIKNYKVSYPVCFDFESGTNGSVQYAQKHGVTINKTLATQMARSFCSKIEGNGYYAMNYGNQNDLSNLFDKSQLSRYDVWFAQYPYRNPPATISDTTCDAKNPHIWQYADNGTVSGISSNSVDMDVSAVDYAAIIRNAGLNHLTSSSGLRTESSIQNFQPLLPPTKIPSGSDKSAPKSGQMDQPGFEN